MKLFGIYLSCQLNIDLIYCYANVNHCKRYIYLQDVIRFMSKDKALKTMNLFGIAKENHGISKSSLKDWMVEHTCALC